jgi:hemerythrin-like metal-binding protein
VKWSDKYATGVERIDEDHKMIFKMAEDFRAALDEGMGDAVYSTLLESLSAYCRGHFGFEEHCMGKFRCPAAKKNKEAHKMFLETLSEFRERYGATGYDHAEARRLVDTVDQWLDDHICHIDVHLKRCVTK